MTDALMNLQVHSGVYSVLTAVIPERRASEARVSQLANQTTCVEVPHGRCPGLRLLLSYPSTPVNWVIVESSRRWSWANSESGTNFMISTLNSACHFVFRVISTQWTAILRTFYLIASEIRVIHWKGSQGFKSYKVDDPLPRINLPESLEQRKSRGKLGYL